MGEKNGYEEVTTKNGSGKGLGLGSSIRFVGLMLNPYVYSTQLLCINFIFSLNLHKFLVVQSISFTSKGHQLYLCPSFFLPLFLNLVAFISFNKVVEAIEKLQSFMP